MSWLGLISNEELSSLANFVTESLWIGAAIFVVAMIVSAAIAFLIEKRKLNKPEKGEGG